MQIRNVNSTPFFKQSTSQAKTAENCNGKISSIVQKLSNTGGANSEENIRLVYGLKIDAKTSQRYLKRYQEHLDEVKKENEELDKIGGSSNEEKEARAKKEAFLQDKVDEYTGKVKEATDALDTYTKGMNSALIGEIDAEAEKSVAQDFGENVPDDGKSIETIIKKFSKTPEDKDIIEKMIKELQKDQEKVKSKKSKDSSMEITVDIQA
jgi:hypothetical protein